MKIDFILSDSEFVPYAIELPEVPQLGTEFQFRAQGSDNLQYAGLVSKISYVVHHKDVTVNLHLEKPPKP